MKDLVDATATVVQGWIDAGRIAHNDPYHLIFSVWSLPQHHADFDVQIRAVLGEEDPFDGAVDFIDTLYWRFQETG